MPKHHRQRSLWHFLWTRAAGWHQQHLFSNVKSYVMFIGYPRSGHTLVGAQMTAHKNMVISNELHALKYIEFGYDRNQLYRLIHQRDQMFVNRECQNGTYQYRVPNQWQGRFEQLTVIGDKKGAGSSQALMRHPEMLDALREKLRIPVRMIHVVRNPFDTISRIHLRNNMSLDKSMRRFFKMCRGVSSVINANPEIVHTIRHEDYVSHPQQGLARVCRFVGVQPTAEYLDDCASIVNQSPRLARLEIEWTSGLINQVRKSIREFEYLADYDFDEIAISRAAA